MIAVCVVVHVVIRARQKALKPDQLAATKTAIQVQADQKRPRWTKPPRFRDREAPGSNPGPPTLLVCTLRSTGIGSFIGQWGRLHCRRMRLVDGRRICSTGETAELMSWARGP